MTSEAAFEDTYEIIGVLGQGGFGIVHKARQRTTGQIVAIKTTLPSNLGEIDPTMSARFLREMRLCAQLYHPNIVQLINAGETPDGQIYAVFAYAPGKSLSRVLDDEGALEPVEAQHLMLQVLDALACAHARGIIHRDLKPGNIIVSTTGARRNAMVLDFGIGTVVSGVNTMAFERLTATSELLGTPGYAAPEQLNGSKMTVAADLFSWGLVFLECLTGQQAFSGNALHEILFKQLGPDPVPIPPTLERHPLGELLAEVTRKNPTNRPQDAIALFKRLERCNLRGLSRAMVLGEVAVPRSMNLHQANTAAFVKSDVDTERRMSNERRQVTAVACRLKLRTVPKDSHAPVDIEERIRLQLELFDKCTSVVEKHGGLRVATYGEQALFVFGYPQAEEQDGKRATRAALALQNLIKTENERLRALGCEASTSIGIHSGVAVAPRSAQHLDVEFVVGLTPTIAAQIAERAPKDTILVSSVVQRILRLTFDFEAQGKLDDAPEALKLFRLCGAQTNFAGTISMHMAAPLIGRDSEVKMLVDRWLQVRNGVGQSCLITGEPGIGKSRLAQALRDRVDLDPHVALSARTSPEAQNSPLFPIVDLLERLLERETDDPTKSKLTRLEAMVGRNGLDSATVPLLATLLALPLDGRYPAVDMTPELRKKRTMEAIRSLIFALADARPVFLLVEDLHWADPTTLELVGDLIERVATVSVYIVLTARPEFSFASLPAVGVLQIALSRLIADDIEALVASIFDRRQFPADVLEQIVKRTDGVPLFIEEFTQMLIESGVLVLRDNRYERVRPLMDSDIPASLRDLLTSRLDRLGVAKETAQLAATLGREFGLALLTATSTRQADEVKSDLDTLQHAGLVQAKRKSGDKGYVFKHALIRDAAYESISIAARRKVHARVAAALEEKFASIVESRPDLLAQHHAAAEQKVQAIRYAKKAAAGALRRSAPAEAAGQVNQALSWVDGIADTNERTGAELDLNSLLMPAVMAMRGAGDDSLGPLTARILALCDALGSNRHRFPTLYVLTTYHHLHANRARALELAQHLVSLAQEAGDTPAELAGFAILAQCLISLGRLTEARAAAERSLALYDPNRDRDMVLHYGVDPKTFAHSMLAEALAYGGYLEQCVGETEKAIAWGRELNLPNMVARSLFFAAFVHRARRDRERTIEVTKEALDLADRHALRFSTIWAGLFHAWATNDADGIRRHVNANRAAGQIGGLPYILVGLAEVELARQNPAQALESVEEALRLADERQELLWYAGTLRVKASCLLALRPESLDVVEALLRQALDVARAQQAKTEELEVTVDLARLLSRQGKWTEAIDMLSAVLAWFTEGFATVPLRDARALREELNRQKQSKNDNDRKDSLNL